MSFFYICLAVILQHFFHHASPGAQHLPGYTRLFAPDQPIGKLGQALACIAWLLFPLLLLVVVHCYLAQYQLGQVALILLFALLAWMSIGYNACTNLASQGQPTTRYANLLPAPRNAGLAALHSYLALLLLRLFYAPALWIMLLNAYGALLVLLVYAYTNAYPNQHIPRQLMRWMEWLPMRLMLIGYSTDRNLSSLPKVLRNFANTQSAEQLIKQQVVPLVLRLNHRRNRLPGLLRRQVAGCLAVLAVLTLVLLLGNT